ncbi:type II secretion system F family protein [Nakamurella sp. GG22]
MVIALLIAAAAVIWPTTVPSVLRAAGRRPGRYFGRRDAGRRDAGRRDAGRRDSRRLMTGRAAVGGAMVPVAAVLLLRWGAAVAIAGAVLAATGWALSRRLRAGSYRRVALEQIVAALRMLARELHAGADPALAAQNTAAAATGEGALVVADLVRAIGTGDRPSAGPRVLSNRLPGRGAPPQSRSDAVTPARSRRTAALEPRRRATARLRSGWMLTRRHGIAFTPLIDALAAELAEQLVADSQRAGEVAGPRMSGYVMAVLPLLGLLLGAGMGADPVEVLLRSHLGNVLLLVGTALTCGGLLWSARIVAR